ncbi:hypothetical protein PFISCL1PPCAC_28705, partial [Pristionchus fissidentatus]
SSSSTWLTVFNRPERSAKMHSSLMVVLLALPCVAAMRCFVGGGTTGSNTYPEIYQQLDCADRNEQYCYKREFTNNNQHMVIKNCGNGFCPREGCNAASGVCCCKGDYCNAAPVGSSLVMTSLVAAAAAWLRQ